MAKRKSAGTNVDALRKQNKMLGEKIRNMTAAKKLKAEIARKQSKISGMGGTRSKKRR